ncbi:MAG: DUF3592 domain-containing protein [Gammaproteobacteria bacterium]
MLNPYAFILGLFAIAGLLTALWGWSIIVKGRKTRRWPAVEGVIEQSALVSDADDLLPHILYRYTVAGQTYRRELEFPGGISPVPEFAASYAGKFPAGAKVQVYYDPGQPGRATLEPGPGRGDWMIFALGLAATVFGVSALLFSGQ